MKKAKEGGRRDEQVLIDLLEDALVEDTGAKGGITVNENNEIIFATVSYQSGQMSALFEKFPEILLVDGTYNVNRARIPLYCLMIKMGLEMVEAYFTLLLLKKVLSTYYTLCRHLSRLIPLGLMFV